MADSLSQAGLRADDWRNEELRMRLDTAGGMMQGYGWAKGFQPSLGLSVRLGSIWGAPDLDPEETLRRNWESAAESGSEEV